MFLCALLLISVSAVAEEYPFRIMGIQVTDENAGSICEIGGETAFRAEKKDDGSYWIYVHQPESADEIVFAGDEDFKECLITFTANIDNVYVCAENNVRLDNKKGRCIGVDESVMPNIKKLYLTSFSGFTFFSLDSYTNAVNPYLIDEIHVSNVQLLTDWLQGIPGSTDLYIEDFGFVFAKKIYKFKTISIQGDANTNAASIKATSDDNGVAARGGDDKVLEDGVIIGKTPLRIFGIDVSFLNATDITGKGISPLDPEKPSELSFKNGCLTLDNVKIESDDPVTAIQFLDPEAVCSLDVISPSAIKCQSGVESEGDLYIGGGGKFTVEGNYGIACRGKLSLAGNCHIKTSGQCIDGRGEGSLDLNDVQWLTAESSYYIITGFSSLSELKPAEKFISNMKICLGEDSWLYSTRDDEGYLIFGGKYTMTQKNGRRIGSYEVTYADELTEGGIDVTGDGISGKVRLEGSALYLEDATINAMTDEVPYALVNNGDIYLKGNNTLNAKTTGITSEKNYRLLDNRDYISDPIPTLAISSGGDGITCPATTTSSIFVDENVALDVSAKGFALYGNGRRLDIEIEDNATVTLQGDLGAMIQMDEVLFDGTVNIVTPGVVCEEQAEGYALLCDGDPYTFTVEIRHVEYYCRVGSLVLTELNYWEQPFVDSSIEGIVTFDKEKGELTFLDATITGPEGDYGVDVGNPVFNGTVTKIVLKGKNVINSDHLWALYSSSYLTITGSGSLSANGYIANEGYLDIDNTTLDGIGLNNSGSCNMTNSKLNSSLYASNNSGAYLTIMSSNVNIEASVYGFFHGGIYNSGYMSIESNSFVTASGLDFGYFGEKGSTLSIGDATVKLKAEYNENGGDPCGSAMGYNMSLSGDVELETTDGATFYEDGDKKFEVRRDEERATGWVTFAVPVDKKKYPIFVGGEQVTALNCADITGENIEGKVSYDPVDRRFTLTDATISKEGIAFGYGAGSTKVLLSGNNAVSGTSMMGGAFASSDAVTFTSADGKGKLTVVNEDEYGTGVWIGGSTTVSNCEIDVTGNGFGIQGFGTFTVESGVVRTQGGEGSLLGYSSFVPGEDISIVEPEYAYYDGETMQLKNGGEIVKEQVVIRYLKYYGVQIASLVLTSDNYTNIKPAELKEGEITYNPEKAELTMSNARIEGEGITVMDVDAENPFTLVLDGKSTIADAAKPLSLWKNVIIKGKTGILTDALDITTELFGINFLNNLTVNDVTLNVTAKGAAVLGTSFGTFRLDRANLKATGDEQGVLQSVGTFVRGERVQFVSPEYAVFDKTTGTLRDGGELVTAATIKWYMPGDANDDYQVDVSDVKDIADNIWEVENPGFVAYNADLNADDVINVTDIVGVVDIILESSATARAKSGRTLARGESRETTDRLSLTCRNGMLTAALTNAEDYYGLQMELRLSPGQTLNTIALSGSCADSHQVAWRQTGEDTYRVVIYSLSPSALIGGNRQMLTLDISGEGTVEASDILAVATDGTRYLLTSATSDMATGIAEIPSDDSDATGVYDLNGRKMSENGVLRKGIYIRNGKKFIVK